MSNFSKFFIFVFCVLILGGALYAHTLDYSWHFDDYEFIVLKEGVHDLADLKAVWNAGSTPARFIAFLSFAMNYHFGGLDVTGYHVVNILIHLFNTILVWLFMLLLCATPNITNTKIATQKYLLASGVALLFLTHPIQTQAVTYITQRFASLATLFYLSSVILFVLGRLNVHPKKQCVYFTAACITAILGMFTKQIVLTLPVMILLVEISFFQQQGKWQNLLKSMKWYYAIIPTALFAIIPMIYQFSWSWFSQVKGASRSHIGDVITWNSYFLTQFRVVPTYFKLLFFPKGQTLDYDFSVSTSFFEPKVILGALFISGVLYFGIRMYKHHRLVAFGIFWFFLALLVESSIIPILQVIFEHRCYLPSTGLFLAIMVLLLQYVKPRQAIVVLSLVVCTFSFLTFQRNKVWATEISLWQDIQKKAPLKERSYIHLGVAYLMQGRYDDAIVQLTKALEINPQSHRAFHNRGVVYSEMKQLEFALMDFQKAMAINQKNSDTFNGRGAVYEQLGKNKKAFADYSKAIELNPSSGSARSNRANILIKRQQYPQALKDLLIAEQLGYPIDADRVNKLEKYVLQKYYAK